MTESVLHSFESTPGDGYYPVAGLTAVGATLYGTTEYGGSKRCLGYGCGTVFAIATSGTYSLLYAFSDAHHRNGGVEPWADLTDVNGDLYGTTPYGGWGFGPGAVFKIAASKQTTLYRFMPAPDGAEPFGSLTDVGGTLFGTTSIGGASGFGTIFRVTQSGRYEQLYSFAGGKDGCGPNSLTNVGGVLYGTTIGCSRTNYGTVFKFTTSGTETVLYHFKGGTDGANPEAGLTDVRGALYGMTPYGGTGSCSFFHSPKGCGTVFKITTAGTETVIYSFKGGTDGAVPLDRLVNVGGILYGTTYYGGGGSVWTGTVFKITTLGQETVLYRFAGTPDAQNPRGGVSYVNGALYGTTVAGGTNDAGAIFSLSGF